MSPPEPPRAAVIVTFQERMESESGSETRFSADRVYEDLPLLKILKFLIQLLSLLRFDF